MSITSLNYNNKGKTIFLRYSILIMATASLLSVGLTANASTLISSTEYLEYELPKIVRDKCYEKNNCPEIEVKYLKTNQNWLNEIVNRRINNIAINSQPSDKPINKATSTKAAKLAIDDFTKAQFEDLPADVPWSYQLTVMPEYLGHIKLGDTKQSQTEDFELFEINSYVFTGGAHGMPLSEYLIFDPSSKQQVKLDDMLQKGKKARFKALAYESYKAWVKTVDEDVKKYEQSWPFTLNDNITLTDKGIDIRYSHYAIGPYAYGMPVLSIPYTKLDGIIKPRFLPSLSSK